ncbi:MAG: CDP-glycerol glycerophosphotransferase family protein [Oscillospiraceae bacterium]|nr:CDP-glycerol glycerophosphotransferase family protein [Oscillospiraceae bacterium]
MLEAAADEAVFLWELMCSKRISDKKAVILRGFSDLARPFFRKPVWLISDRIDKADDNGEVFFRYVVQNHRQEINAFFILSPQAAEYSEVKKTGKVVRPYSWRHKLLALIADWSISSQTDNIFRDPFWDYGQPYRDMLRKTRFVFLQHGVLATDCSRWLNKDRQQFDGFVTSSVRETESILHGNYGYTDEQVWMTGLTRFDRLYDKREKLITIMPTWRRYLGIRENAETGEWILKPGFEESGYVKFYRQLMGNAELREAAENYGYSLQIKLHPTFQCHMDKFHFGEDVNVAGRDISYAEIYNRSSLIVTDYSSAIHDFIYLKKPVVYCQFDYEEFFSGEHMCEKGEFDYEADGYGEVTYNIEDAVRTIIQYMKNNCETHEPYTTRILKAFPDRSPDHCERLYQKIRSKDICTCSRAEDEH